MDLAMIEPYTPWIVLVVTGIIAGWLAGLIVGGGGLIRNLIVGIIGAVVGGFLVNSGILQLPGAITSITDPIPYGTQILVAAIGAIIVVLLARVILR